MKTTTQRVAATVSPKKPRQVVSESKPRQTARLFTNGASQAVRLPKAFRMEGTEVRIWKEGDRVVMQPVRSTFSWDEWADALARFEGEFMPEGRQQPPLPAQKILFDE